VTRTKRTTAIAGLAYKRSAGGYAFAFFGGERVTANSDGSLV
jgi:hypothetical protein